MNDYQSDQGANQGAKTRSSPRNVTLVGAAATALAVFNMMTDGPEVLSPAVMALQYALLAGGLFALVGGLIMMAKTP